MRLFSFTRTLIIYLTLCLALSSCTAFAPPQPSSTPLDVSAIQTAGVATYIADLTRRAPSLTPTLAESSTPVPTNTPQPTSTPTVTLTPSVTIDPYLLLDSSNLGLLPTHLAFYIIAPMSEDPCRYYLKPVLPFPYPERSGKLEQDVTSALNILFNVNTYYIGGFPNPLAPSGHTLLDIKTNGGRMDIYITGNPARTDNPCTNRMMRDQIFKTVHEISDKFGVTEVIIWQDGLLYDDYMIGG